jgi:hypothetical protein
LVARFTEPARYFLAYGNRHAGVPRYDIERFAANIPDVLQPLELGAEQALAKPEAAATSPLFKNKAWLWALMVVVIVVLGWFTVSMMRKR